MDYALKTCKNMFTEGQRNRMRAMLETSRSSLLESLGAQPVVDNDLTVLGLSYPGDTTCVAMSWLRCASKITAPRKLMVLHFPATPMAQASNLSPSI